MLGVDLMGPFGRSSNGNLYLIVFVDYCTIWGEMFPLQTATADSLTDSQKGDLDSLGGTPFHPV